MWDTFKAIDVDLKHEPSALTEMNRGDLPIAPEHKRAHEARQTTLYAIIN